MSTTRKIYDDYDEALSTIRANNIKHVVVSTERRENVLAEFAPNVMVTLFVALELEANSITQNYDGDWYEVKS